jgi:polar amino acid transport system substrate-binding protein
MRVLSLVLCLLVWSSRTQADQIRLAADNWCPHNCQEGSDKPGYMVELAKLIFGKAKHTIDYKTLNWSRALVNCRRGEIDGLVAAVPPDAPELIYPKVESGLMQITYFSLKERSWNFAGLSSLEAITLGVIQDYGYSQEIVDYVAQHKASPKRLHIATGEDPLQKNIKMLMAGRIDALIEDKSVFLFQAKEMGVSDKFRESVAQPSPSAKLYIAFCPKNPKAKEWSQLFSAGILEARKTGDLARILTRYGLKDWL